MLQVFDYVAYVNLPLISLEMPYKASCAYMHNNMSLQKIGALPTIPQ